MAEMRGDVPGCLVQRGKDLQVRVRVKPNAGRDRAVGVRDGRLLLEVKPPPRGGKANEAVCKLVAKTVGISKGRVKLVKGARSRDKSLSISSMTIELAAGRIGGL